MRAIVVTTARVLRGFLDAIAAILGLYYTTKYAALAKRLGLPRAPTSKQRGFVVIQVDGLSHDCLCAAIERGYAPYMARLVRRGEFVLQPWRVGLPSNTVAVQAGIMFGQSDDIPAFRWYDKPSGQAVTCALPSVAHAIQQRLAKRAPGILRGGSSFMNMLDGDAAMAMFTLGAFFQGKRFFENVRGAGFFLLFLLNPLRTAKMLLLSVWEYLTDLVQRTCATLRQRTPRPFGRMFPFLRVMSNVVLREIQTFAVLMDIYRGMPAIYTTYFGYDEVAHQYGILSKPALRALRAVDARIRRIDGFRRLALGREYDLYVLSDHGMTTGEPFRLTYGQTLGEALRDLAGKSVALSESLGASRQDVFSAVYLQGELAAIAANVRPPLAEIPERLRAFVARRITLREDDPPPDLSRRMDLIVRDSGPMSHVYFNIREGQMDLGEVMASYPMLVAGLLVHPGIWCVVARQGEQTHILGPEGVLLLDGEHRVEGIDPLGTLPDPRWAAEQLHRVASYANAGDLILMGRYDPQAETVVCFEDQWACHGGLGGPQQQAFMLSEPSVGWNLASVRQASELYPLFMRRYAA
jgi:hypothetical protein